MASSRSHPSVGKLIERLRNTTTTWVRISNVPVEFWTEHLRIMSEVPYRYINLHISFQVSPT
jgi:hypothetical protein